MSSKPKREVAVCLRPRRRVAATLAAALIVLLAATPTTSALASADSSGSGAGTSAPRPSTLSGQSLASAGELLPAAELETLLSSLPLEDLSATQLAHYLAGLEGINELTNLEMGLLSGKHLGVKGLEETLSKAIKQLGASAKLGELAQVEDLLPALETALEGKLGGLLSALPGSGSGVESALGSLNLDQLVGSLLSSTKPEEQLATELSSLAGGLFGELSTEGKLGDLLGSELTGGFVPKSVKEVAEELQSTPKAVSEELGQTATQLPETTTMLTAPLTEGKVVGLAPAVDGVVPAVRGLALGLLGGSGEGGEGEKGAGKSGEGEGEGEKGAGKGGEGEGKGSGEGGKGTGGSSEGSGKGSGEGNGSGTGGQGGPGGTGSGGSTGGVTILLTPPGTFSAQSAPTVAAKHQLGKISVISHRVKGRVATIVLKVPAAGKVTLTGKDLRSATAHPVKAERLAVRVSLSKAGTASLHRGRHHRLPVKLKVSFTPTSGSGSSTTLTLSFA